MNDCLFCKIISREIPADIIYEDEQTLVFLDINPVRKGHTLIIPKQHYRWIQDVPDEVLSHNFLIAKKIILSMKQAFSCDFTQLVVEGNEVPHFHISVIPGYSGQSNATFVHEAYGENESSTYAAQIKNAL